MALSTEALRLRACAYSAKRRALMKAQGLCVCGNVREDQGFSYCSHCRQMFKERYTPKHGRHKPPEERFWSYVDKSEGCWLWTGHRHWKGYGYLYFKGRPRIAHRVAWMITHGDIPAELLVCHKCDNPPCCNPDHLFLGTAQDNTNDMVRKGRQRWGKVEPSKQR